MLVTLMLVSFILLCLAVALLALTMPPYQGRKRKPSVRVRGTSTIGKGYAVLDEGEKVTQPVRKAYPLADDWFTLAESTGVGRDRRPKHRA